jgi:glycerol-3-phosphate cytidylyltransferase
MSDKIVYTGGTFDLYHFGHLNFLRQCALLGKVVIALNTDEFIEKYKGQKPVISYKHRKKMLESCPYVFKVVPNEGDDDSKITINKVKPDIIAIGTDWLTKDYYHQMGFTQEWLDKHNIVLAYLPYTADISTTMIKERMKK